MNKLKPPIFCLLINLFVLIGFLPAQDIFKKYLPKTVNFPLASDSETRIDANNIDMFVTNYGSIGHDESGGSAGFTFPKGSNLSSIYYTGLSVGALVAGELRVAVAYYDQEFGPGTIEGGNPSDPEDPRFRVYKITTGDGPGTPDWDEWPFSDGAPDDGSGNPRLFGDQTLWAVFNDADPARHTSSTGSTDPLGIEVQLTVFAYRWPTTQANSIYIKYRIINKGSNILEDTYFQFWHDPDLGQFQNDFVGFDTNLDMGYCYNADKYDELYQAVQPALGFIMLQGPEADGGGRMALTSFNANYQSGNRRPENAQERYNLMQGLATEGFDIIDPTTSSPTKFMFSGDPLSSTGWIDEYIEDKSISINSGPFTMAPDDTQEVIYAIMVGQGEDHLNSIEILRAMVPEVENLFNAGFPDPNPPTADAAAVCIHQPAYGSNLESLIPSATVAHLGSGTESFSVNYIITLDGVPEYQSTRTTASLSAGNTEYIEFDNWFPSEQGIFDVELSVSLTGDADNSNDILQTTIEVTNPPAPINLRLISRVSGEAVLSWNPPLDYSDILGYNIHRSYDSGGPYTKLNSTLVTELTYTDYTIPNDVVFYVVTYETSTGFESHYSNELLVYPVMIVSDENILLVNGVRWDDYGQQIIDFYEQQMAGTNVFDFWDLFTDNPVGFTPVGEGQAPPWDLFQQYKSVIWIGNNYQGDLELWNESLAALKQYMLYGGNVLLATRMAENFFDDDLRINYAHIDNWSGYNTIGESNPLVALIPGIDDMGPGNGSTESTYAQMFMESTESLPDNITTFTPSFEFDDLEGTIWKAGFRSELAGGGQFVFISGRPYRFDENASRENYNYILENWFGHPEYSKEMLANGDFELGIDPWYLAVYDDDASATFDIDESGLMQGQNSAHITIDQSTNINWHIQLRQDISVSKDRYYIIRYQARSNQNTTVETWLQQDHDPWIGYAVEEIQLTTETQTYTDTAIVDQDDTAVLAFMLGNSGLCEIWFDSVSVIEKVGTFEPVPVTFQADLTNFISAGWFDPTNPEDSIVVNGDFNYWSSQEKMTPDPGNANIYQYTANITRIPGDIIQWKFRLFPEEKWQNSGWEVGENRRTLFTGEDMVLDPIEPNIIYAVTDFAADLVVFDDCANSINLVFGTAPDATDGYDEAYDQYAPPPPPSGAFDARFHISGDDLIKDFRATNTETTEWDLEFRPASGCEPATVQWNPAQLPDDGSTFRLVDYFTSGSLVNVDMRITSSHVDNGENPLGHFKIINSLTVPCDVELVSGWNMIGVSVEPLDAVAANLFPNMIPPLYRFIGSYDPVTEVENGAGYWERNTVNETVSIEGYPFASITISLMNGWNMIAGPTCTVALADITDPLGIIIPGTLYGFDGAYVSSEIIEPCRGYWLRTNAAGDITLSCPTQPAGVLAKTTGQLPQLDDFGRLIITDAKGAEQTLYLNVELEDEAMLESYILPPLPPAGLFDARFSSGYRISLSDEELIQLQASEYPVSISISNVVHDSAFTYVLTELVDNMEITEHLLGEGETVEITNSKVTQLKLSKRDMLAIPTAFAVSQNCPNPFNPTTEIEYALPENEKVTIVIYNQLGQKVKTLLAQYQEAGYHKVSWNGTNENDSMVASGIYFYTVTAGKNIAIKKMILLK